MTREEINNLVAEGERLNNALDPRSTPFGKPFTTPEWRFAIQLKRIYESRNNIPGDSQ